MKLYYIANARMPNKKAYAIQIAKMCEAFVDEGVDLELIVPNFKSVTESITKYYELRSTVRLIRLPAVDLYLFGKWGYFLSGLSFMVSYSLYLLVRRLQGNRGVVYTIDMDTFSFMASVFLGMPCFLETHGGKAMTRMNTVFFKRVNGIIVINSIIKKQIAETIDFPEQKILVWPNGVDLDLFRDIAKEEARKKISLPKERKIVMYCGRFYRWKGLEVLVDAATKLSSDIFVYLVGGTKEDLVAMIKEKELPKNLVFPGEKSYNEIPVWLSAADALFVLGTKYDTQSYYYTSPMKIFEYLAMKRPVIASETPALKEVVSSREVVFYEPDNAEDLAIKINSVVHNLDSVNERVVAAWARSNDFTWHKRAKDILEFIKKYD